MNRNQRPRLRPGADLAAADEVSFRDDADELAGVVDHREAADVPLQHDVGRLDDAGIGGDRDDRPGHDLMGAHGRLRWLVEFQCAKPSPAVGVWFDSGQAIQAASPWLSNCDPCPDLMQLNTYRKRRHILLPT
ncbi:hypothetical protein ACVJA9_007668 [Bradyrhizobium diazoefficiens]